MQFANSKERVSMKSKRGCSRPAKVADQVMVEEVVMEWPPTTRKKRNSRGFPSDVEQRKPLFSVNSEQQQKKKKNNNNKFEQSLAERTQLRSGYGKICNLISVERADLTRVESKKFMTIINEVEQMHRYVKKPREQVADAEALLGLADTLQSSVRRHSVGGITPTDFVSSLLEQFGRQGTTGTDQGVATKQILWKDIGQKVSPVFRNSRGCCTILGPLMKYELKQRKARVYRKSTKPSAKARPREVKSDVGEMRDTDRNMLTMFEILRQKRNVKLEYLLLNRKSFAQTVENLFALSFLVKDGRVQIAVDEKGSHIVSPRNAPRSEAVMSGEVVYTHFTFRLDFCDWKLMKGLVPEGHELMPIRNYGLKLSGDLPDQSQSVLPTYNFRSVSALPNNSQFESTPKSSWSELGARDSQASTPIKVYSRKRRAVL